MINLPSIVIKRFYSKLKEEESKTRATSSEFEEGFSY